MIKQLFCILFIVFLIHSLLFGGGLTNNKMIHKVRVITAEDEARFEEKMKNATSNFSYPKLSNELGRTWYDYACNNVMGRMMDKSADGIHFVFMGRQPNASGNRYVTYDYWHNNFNLFFGNMSITENQPTGWGRAINGKNNEALSVMHGGGLHLYKDATEAGYTFIEMWTAGTATGGVFPGLAVTGDTVFVMGQLTNGNWFGGDTIGYSFDYMNTWSGSNIWPPDDPAMNDYGPGEMWPTFNPVVPGEVSVVYAPDVTASAPSGSIKMATTNDFGSNWNLYEIHNDDYIFPDNSQLIIENFAQMNSMYGMDGTYHVVMGAIQGYADIYASTQSDIFPLIYWNTREQQFVELSDFNKSHPADTTVQTILVSNRPGNGLGGFNYPTLSEGPNGELVCIWQEWEDGGSGVPVIATPTGGDSVFCTDIWGAYSPDGGRSWSIPFFVAGTAGESDVFPNISKNFVFDATGDSIVIDIAYMWDTNAGVSFIVNNTDPSECIWYYERVSVYPQFGQISFITSVNPDSAYTGQNLSVSIVGQNTIFLQDTITTDHVYFLMSNDTIEASNVNVLNTTALVANFSIPTTATTGYWDVNVEQVGGAGVVQKGNGFWIYERLVDSLTLSVETTDAFAGDTVVINVEVEIPQDSAYSSTELYLSGFQNKLEFLELVTNNTLIGNAGWGYQVNDTDSVLSIAAAGANDISGVGTLLKLKFCIPDTTQSGFIAIHVDSVVLNTGNTNVRSTSGGISIIIPNPGDVDLNELIQAYDASLILKHLVGLITLRPTQLSNANVSLDSTVSALDADIILQYVVGLIDTLPFDTTIITNGKIRMEDGIAIPGEVVEIPLYFENILNVRGVESEITYDPTQLSLDEIIWNSVFDGTFKISNNEDGILQFASAGLIPSTTSVKGIVLRFRVNSEYSGENIQVKLSKLRFNEGEYLINSSSANLSVLAGITEDNVLPHKFYLYNNYPNPFNPSSTINFDLPVSCKVKLSVYDTQGKLVSVLISDNLPAGNHSALFDASGMSTGLYLYKIQAGDYMNVKKMLLLK